uniref:MARVEL domain-containing protein n=1 Tax=Chromera velia CCMP2878 TaxID=1169474 RepID=A0A0G4H573_9ALVE|eukprot:Cvel_854.t1-p1 / transcript=Cvel_854.t1 / gene=Cvel_854 / organism=Chromera_velia_CCMP2878 / gene_product=hypothetical protein / transcript_product=hypothetical protein / location=Cvel_scaffold26:168365-169708(+) / protein_length=211 / sequence_SO=supercontig / SO=protein_coding / is_pseudo=false
MRACCFCLPLRIGVIICSVLSIAVNVLSFIDGSEFFGIILSVIFIACGIAGTFAAIQRNPHLLQFYMIYAMIAFGINLILTIVYALGQNAEAFWGYLVTTLVYLFLCGLLTSFDKVLRAGGTGDEMKSASELRTLQWQQQNGGAMSQGYPQAHYTPLPGQQHYGNPQQVSPYPHQQPSYAPPHTTYPPQPQQGYYPPPQYGAPPPTAPTLP